MYELCHRVAFLYNDLLCPVDKSSVGILHSHRDDGRQNVQGLTDDGASLQSVGLEETEQGGGGREEEEQIYCVIKGEETIPPTSATKLCMCTV